MTINVQVCESFYLETNKDCRLTRETVSISHTLYNAVKNAAHTLTGMRSTKVRMLTFKYEPTGTNYSYFIVNYTNYVEILTWGVPTEVIKSLAVTFGVRITNFLTYRGITHQPMIGFEVNRLNYDQETETLLAFNYVNKCLALNNKFDTVVEI